MFAELTKCIVCQSRLRGRKQPETRLQLYKLVTFRQTRPPFPAQPSLRFPPFYLPTSSSSRPRSRPCPAPRIRLSQAKSASCPTTCYFTSASDQSLKTAQSPSPAASFPVRAVTSLFWCCLQKNTLSFYLILNLPQTHLREVLVLAQVITQKFDCLPF